MKGSGTTVNETAGENLGNHKLVYRGADGYWYLADSDAAATMPVLGITMGAVSSGRKGEFLLDGYIGDNSWTWTAGDEVYATSTPGEMSQTAPSGGVIQIVAIAADPNIIQFTGKTGGGEGQVVEGASYVIETDGTTIWAKNGLTGSIDYSGIDASTVIQDVIDTFPDYGTSPPYGGKILFTEGIYTLTSQLDVSQKVSLTLEGVSMGAVESGRGAVFHLANGADCHMVYGLGTAPRFYYLTLRNLTFYGNKDNNTGNIDCIYLESVKKVLIENVGVFQGKRHGIYLNTCEGSLIQNGYSLSCDSHNIRLNSNASYIINHYSSQSGGHGIYVGGSNNVKLIGVHVDLCEDSGCRAENTKELDVIGCSLFENDHHGFEIFGAESTQILGGHYKDNSQQAIGGWNGIRVHNSEGATIIGVKLYDSQVTATQQYGLEETGTTTKTRILGCYFDGNATGNFNLIGAGTIAKYNTIDTTGTDSISDVVMIHSKTFRFTEAVNGAVNNSSPTGIDVDANTEQALTWGQLPPDIQKVYRLKIWAISTGTPVNAGGQMHCEFTWNAGASNAAYNEAGKSWGLVNHDSEEADYAVNDVVHWMIEDGDVGNELVNLVAGDSFELFAIHEAAADPDGATDAVFRVLEVEYV